MTQYLIRRLLIAIPSIFGISIVLFNVLALAPGDPFEELATNPAVPPDVRAALRQSLGLDDPVHVRYIAWLTARVSGPIRFGATNPGSSTWFGPNQTAHDGDY